MQRCIAPCMLIIMIVLSSATTADAQSQAKFWFGGGFRAFYTDGTGTAGRGSDAIDVDFSTPYFTFEDEFGLNWGNKLLLGLKPELGIKFNDMFGISAAYAFYFTKKSDDSFREQYTDGLYYYDETGNMVSEWSQKSIELLVEFHPSQTAPGFYLLAGLDLASFEIDIAEDYQGEMYDMNGILIDYYSYSDSYREDDSTTGFLFGLGYEFTPASTTSFYLRATYSLAKYDDDKLFDGIPLELKVGGFAGELGLRYYFGG